MAEFSCPGCQAEIEADLLERTGQSVCPFCGADLSALGLPAPAAGLPEQERGLAAGASSADRPLPPVPKKSAIRVIESTADRLVLFIPGGGQRAGGLGCFALVWNLFIGIFTLVFSFAGLKGEGGDAPPFLAIAGFLSLFWIVGLLMAFFWAKMRFERTTLLIEPERAAVQRIFFNRRKVTEAQLHPGARAGLVESYQQNDQPVYRIEIPGSPAAVKFGTPLSDPEKDWLVDRINEFLGAPAGGAAVGDATGSIGTVEAAAPALVYPNSCEKCAAPLGGKPVDGIVTCEHCGAVHRGQPAPAAAPPPEVYERLTASELPAGCGIDVLEASRERLIVRYDALHGSPTVRVVIPLVTIPFAIAWYSILAVIITGMLGANIGMFAVFPLLFAIPFIAAGLMPLGIGLFALWGKTTIDLSPERLQCRWSLGKFGFSRSLPTREITSLRLEEGDDHNDLARRRRGIRVTRMQTGQGSTHRACVARTADRMLLLTLMQGEPFSRTLTSLLRTQLADMGHPVPDV